MEALIETWLIHDRIHRYLLAAVPDAGLDVQAAGKGRTPREHFAHLHNVRLMWLKESAPELHAKQVKLEKDVSREDLVKALESSGTAIAELLKVALAPGGRVKGFKPHASAFLGYLISHESHHRGQIVQTLKLGGHPVDKKTAFGLWEWGVR